MQETANAENAARVLTDWVNHMFPDEYAFIEQITHNTHPTIQQHCASLMFNCIKAWAELEKSGNYDERNQATVKTCRQIVDAMTALGNSDFDKMPCV